MYDSKYLLYTLDINSGDPINPGIVNSLSVSYLFQMAEANGYIILLLSLSPSPHRIDIIDPMTNRVAYQLAESQIEVFGIYSSPVNGEDYIYLSGHNTANDIFYISRAYPDNLVDLGGYISQSITWSNITTDYKIQSLSSVTSLTYVSKDVTINPLPSYASYDPSTSYTNIIEYSPALFNDAFIQRVRANNTVPLQFEWACSHPLATVTTFGFQLRDLGSQTRPTWIILDVTAQTLTLNTPNVTEPEDFEFGLETSYNSKSYLKEFHITVVPCLISN